MTIAEAKQIVASATTAKTQAELVIIKQAICVLASSFAILNEED